MEDSFQERTEAPTLKRLKEARERGFIAKSPLLASGIILLFGILSLYFFSNSLLNGLESTFFYVFTNLNSDSKTAQSVESLFKEGVFSLSSFLLPLFGLLFIGAIYSWLLQVGLLATPKTLKPSLKQLNIFNPSSYKQLFGLQALLRLFRDLCKLAIFFGLIAALFHFREDIFLWINISSTKEFFALTCYLGFLFSLFLVLPLILLGVIDLAFQKWRIRQELRMTKQEVKEELRNNKRMATPKI